MPIAAGGRAGQGAHEVYPDVAHITRHQRGRERPCRIQRRSADRRRHGQPRGEGHRGSSGRAFAGGGGRRAARRREHQQHRSRALSARRAPHRDRRRRPPIVWCVRGGHASVSRRLGGDRSALGRRGGLGSRRGGTLRDRSSGARAGVASRVSARSWRLGGGRVTPEPVPGNGRRQEPLRRRPITTGYWRQLSGRSAPFPSGISAGSGGLSIDGLARASLRRC